MTFSTATLSITVLRKMAPRIMTLSITIFCIMTFCITILGIKTLSI